MANAMQYEELGRYLKQQRELRGLSLEVVARTTKIPSTLIVALETGQFERLPARVFVINYIRAYAQVIGLAADEAVLRYEEVDRQAAAAPPIELEQKRKKRALASLAAVLLAVLVAVLVTVLLLGHAPLSRR